MTGIKILSTIPFIITATVANTGDAKLQYGALGLCAMIVVWLCAYINKLSDKLDKKDAVLGDLYAKNTEAYNRLAQVLEDRPCLQGDQRVKG